MRYRSLFTLTLLAARLLAVAPLSVEAQQTAPARGLFISGYVREEESQHAIRAITLQLMSESGTTASPSVVSGTGGEFQFNGVVSGNYWITANEKGYEPLNISIMLGGIPLTNVLVNLHRTRSVGPLTSGDAISAHQLSIPDKARDAFDKGAKLLAGGKPDYRKAISYFERAIREYADYYEAYCDMGIAYHHLNDEAVAERALRKSVELSNGRYPDALLLLAELLNDSNRFAEAETFARQCATQDESSWHCDLELARSLAGMKHPAEAEPIAVKSSQLNPNNAETFLVLGNIHIQQRRYGAVVQDFDAYLKLNPSGPQSDNVRASQEQARRALARTSSPAPNLSPQ